MIAAALIPLMCYFVFLTSLHFRKTPAVLNGPLDFQLLAWGLFGIITFGPGRLLIPLYVFAAWGFYTWCFWAGFYFLVIQTLSPLFNRRIVVYNGKRELVLPALFSLAKTIDPKTDWAGNVLSLHGLGMQWTVSQGLFGGHLLLVQTETIQKNPNQQILQQQLQNLCRTLEMPKSRLRYFSSLTLGLCCFVIWKLIIDFPILIQQYAEYWI